MSDRVRRAVVNDATSVATVHVLSSLASYAPLVFVTVGGFVHGGPARRSEPGVPFEVYAIHVMPDERGSGLGAALWEAIREELAGPLYVDTLAELRCCSFYERLGGERVEERPARFHGADRTHVTYRFR